MLSAYLLDFFLVCVFYLPCHIHVLYACESCTLTAELEKRTQAFEMRCYRRLLNISYEERVSNEDVRRKIQAAIGKYEDFLTLVALLHCCFTSTVNI